jgi:hypothetical protein
VTSEQGANALGVRKAAEIMGFGNFDFEARPRRFDSHIPFHAGLGLRDQRRVSKDRRRSWSRFSPKDPELIFSA